MLALAAAVNIMCAANISMINEIKTKHQLERVCWPGIIA